VNEFPAVQLEKLNRPEDRMTNTSEVCAECGSTVFADAPEGVCSVCLFRTGLASLGNENDETFEQTIARMPKDFGDYELLEELGRGGQGVVFRARQKSLNRTVALKVIGLGEWATKAHLKRFRLEAEAAASLDHPGIVPIHEVGERDGSCYFSMKLVEGGQLDEVVRREPMSIQRAVELIAKVARTVHYAHEHGILHRDIKPGNILLDKKGEPHLTDFGLARLVESESTVTRTLEVLGTPSYMAPEQAAGNNTQLTSTTDVYGIGAVLYQLLTGHPPFAGGTTYETIKLLLETEPRPPRLWNSKIDRDLAIICLKCLEKDPQRRYSSALALAEDLERWLKHEPIQARRTGVLLRGGKWVQRNPTTALLFALSLAFATTVGVIIWKSTSLPSPPSDGVAVLPFVDLSPAKDQEYFCDGISEEILDTLAKVEGLRVVARTSSFSFKGKNADVTEIARKLNVRNILEGSLRREGNRIRVTAQLINARDGFHIWSDTFERELQGVFAVQDEITRAIVDALKIKLAVAPAHTQNTEAYDLYLKGLYYSNKSDEQSLRKSLGLFQRAVDIDPNFARAWTGIAKDWEWLADAYVRPLEAYPAMRAAAQKAIQLDDKEAEAHVYFGDAMEVLDFDVTGCQAELRRALQLDPNCAIAHLFLAFEGADGGDPETALKQVRQAVQLDPLSPIVSDFASSVYLTCNRLDDAVAEAQRTESLAPNSVYENSALGRAYREKGMLAEAVTIFTRSSAATGVLQPGLAITYAKMGRKDDALRVLEQITNFGRTHYVAGDEIASIYVALGDNDAAFQWLERAYQERSGSLRGVLSQPMFRSLYSDPRYANLVKRIGFDPAKVFAAAKRF
jgi:serine/threonine-protein kinase